MCGRFVSTSSSAELAAEFAVEHLVGPDLAPSYNVAPTQQVRIVAERVAGGSNAGGRSSGDAGYDAVPDEARARNTERQLRTVRWGLVPHWAKDPAIGTRMINARSETVASKPSFRAPAARRRCLVPADGYYEWMGEPGHKTPYFLHDPDGGMLAMAGLYEIWHGASYPDGADVQDDHVLWTCTVITRSAPDALGHIHDRSPVLVPADMYGDWLDCVGSGAAEAESLLAAMPPPVLEPREVSQAVGNVRNNSPHLIDPVSAVPPGEPEALF